MRKLPWIHALPFWPALHCLAAAYAMAQQNQPNQPKNHVFTAGPADEQQLAKEVRHNLLMLPYYSIFDSLSFQLNGSVVTLEGACPPDPPYDIQKDAENVVKKIPGVTQVVNNIKLTAAFSHGLAKYGGPRRKPSTAIPISECATGTRRCRRFISSLTTAT